MSRLKIRQPDSKFRPKKRHPQLRLRQYRTDSGSPQQPNRRAEIKNLARNTEIWTYAYDPLDRRFSKERQDKLTWMSTEPKHTHFVWDCSRLLQEYTYIGCYTYLYTDPDNYEPLAQVRNWTTADGENRQQTHYCQNGWKS